METKVCSKCGRELPATSEYFAKENRTLIGLAATCKDCRKKYFKGYSEKNKERIAEYRQEYYKNNKDKIDKYGMVYRKNNAEKERERLHKYYNENKNRILERNSAYNEKYCEINKDKLSKYRKLYRELNKEHFSKKAKEWREQHKGELLCLQRKWKSKNRDKLVAYEQKRRAKKKILPNTLTKQEWDIAKETFGNKCAYCGGTHNLTQEHFVPLSKGGGYTADNIIPACIHCNDSKLAKDFFEWYPKYKYYSKERETAILEFLDLAKEEAI